MSFDFRRGDRVKVTAGEYRDYCGVILKKEMPGQAQVYRVTLVGKNGSPFTRRVSETRLRLEHRPPGGPR